MKPLDYAGLALANSLAVTGEVIALLVVLRRRWGAIEGHETLLVLGRVLLASLAMGGAILLATQLGERAGAGQLLIVAMGGILGFMVYLLTARLLGVREDRPLRGRRARPALGRPTCAAPLLTVSCNRASLNRVLQHQPKTARDSRCRAARLSEVRHILTGQP